MRNSLYILVTSFAMVGCSGTMHITPAEPKPIQSSFSFDTSYDQAWLLAVDWFAENNIVIDKIEKDSGLITAKYDLRLYPSALNCGDVQPSTLATVRSMNKVANLNMTVRDIDKDKTRVNINIAGSYNGTAYDEGWGKTLTFSGLCYSTGTLEQSVANYISNRID